MLKQVCYPFINYILHCRLQKGIKIDDKGNIEMDKAMPKVTICMAVFLLFLTKTFTVKVKAILL